MFVLPLVRAAVQGRDKNHKMVWLGKDLKV